MIRGRQIARIREVRFSLAARTGRKHEANRPDELLAMLGRKVPDICIE